MSTTLVYSPTLRAVQSRSKSCSFFLPFDPALRLCEKFSRSTLFRPLVERQWHDLRVDHPAAHIDLNCAARDRKLDGNVSHANVLFEKGRRTPGGDLTHASTFDQHDLAITRDAAIGDCKTYQLSLDAFLFLFRQTFAADEIAFIKLANPTEVGFEQRRCLIDLVTIQAHSCFQPQGIARGQPAWQHAVFRAVLSGLQNLVPELLCFVCRRVNFKAILARVSGAGNYRFDPVNLVFGKVVVLNLSERNGSEVLQDRNRVRTLQSNLAIICAHILEFDILVATM